MTRLLAVFLIFCTQVFAIVAPGNVIVCVQADGRSAIELVGSLCCDTNRESEPGCCTGTGRELPEQRGAGVAPGGDPCRDVPLTQDQSFVARASVERPSEAPSEHRAGATSTAVVWETPQHFVPTNSIPREVMARPPEVRLRRPCFVSLRI